MSEHHTHPDPAVRGLIEAARVQGRREALAPVLALADDWARAAGDDRDTESKTLREVVRHIRAATQALRDGCPPEHSPASNPRCIHTPATPGGGDS